MLTILDWLVISDHAEMYGLMPRLLNGDPNLLATEQGKSWYDALKSGDKKKMFATAMEIVAFLQKPSHRYIVIRFPHCFDFRPLSYSGLGSRWFRSRCRRFASFFGSTS